MMSNDAVYTQLWEGLSDRQAPQTCEYAELLVSWAEPAVSAAEHSRNLMQVLQTRLLLVDKFMTIRSHAPKAHAYTMTPKHICLWVRFEEYYNRLCIAEIPLSRPLFLPEPPVLPAPPPEPIRPSGELFIGFEDDE